MSDIYLVVAPSFNWMLQELEPAFRNDMKVDRSRNRVTVPNAEYIYINPDNPDSMRGYRCKQVLFWGNFGEIPPEKYALLKEMAASVERP